MVCLQNDFLQVEIATKGAEVKKIYHRQFELDYLWNSDATYWNRSSPVLFPIVGKLKDNQYTYRGKAYTLTQHGFARDADFVIERQEAHQATFSLSSSEQTKAVYPFDFKLFIHYTLSDSTLLVGYEVLNTGNDELLFSIGAHPGFHCPLEQGLAFEDYHLSFEKPETTSRLLVGRNGISRDTEPVFEKGSSLIPLDYSLFGKKDAIIFKELESSYMDLKSDHGKHGLRFSFKGFPYMGIWTKPGPFLCIEPWYGIADFEDADRNLGNKEGMNKLGPQEKFEAEYSLLFF